ncbi:MAG: C4-dicarboxylate ABC transporter permease, partial [Rhodospirillales bacterium]|nr:C4-dicarboxylate ABC transporter permease [Rhodospirillales bacterium]
VKGSNPIKSKISKVRRALKGKKPKPEKAAEEYAKALSAFATEVRWRKRAAVELLSGLNTYDIAIRDTIGLRQQERLNTEQAAEIASCKANHRDISLDF